MHEANSTMEMIEISFVPLTKLIIPKNLGNRRMLY